MSNLILVNHMPLFFLRFFRDQFNGNLQTNGETLTLIKPGATPAQDLVVDKVRYDGVRPWPGTETRAGSSFQLIDSAQDNSRVGNWYAVTLPPQYSEAISTPSVPLDGWRFFSASGSIGTGEGGANAAMRLLVYLNETGSAIIDDLSIVAGTNAGVGPTNYVYNGNFEAPFATGMTNQWFFGTNYTNSQIIGDLVHSGAGAFKIVGASPGNANPPSYNRAIQQFLFPPPAVSSTNTLSFWYWATNSATNLYVRVRNSAFLTTSTNSGPTNINIFVTPSNYVPATVVATSLSPGSSNLVSGSLPAFPTLWINEVQAENTLGILDNYGEHEPWIELYNTSTNTVSLEGLFLTDTYTNYTAWAFPPGSSIGPTQFLVVFCDGEAGETAGSEYHTSFRLPANSGSVALSRL